MPETLVFMIYIYDKNGTNVAKHSHSGKVELFLVFIKIFMHCDVK